MQIERVSFFEKNGATQIGWVILLEKPVVCKLAGSYFWRKTGYANRLGQISQRDQAYPDIRGQISQGKRGTQVGWVIYFPRKTEVPR